MRKFPILAGLTALGLAVPLVALAQEDDPIAQAIEARHGYFIMLARDMGVLSAMAKGEVDYNEEAAVRAATNIEVLTKYDLPGLFVPGSASNEAEDSEAKPAIWSDPEGFRSKFDDLAKAAAGAPAAVKGGASNIGPVLGKLGGACKACHDEYREKS